MAERRRIIPASVGPLFQPKEEKSWKPAVRFELTLGEPNDSKCTEFSYRQLYKNAVGENSEDKKFNDLEEEDISGLAAFAKRFEEKYAASSAKSGKKGKRRDRVDDLMDVGMGYDDTDPFVDNSECYDELVPSVLTTQLGGFYINQGQLNFREISDSDDDEYIHPAKSKKTKTPKLHKKRKSSFEEKERKKKKQEKKAKKQLQKQFGLKKNSSGSPTVAELLKRQQLHDASKLTTSSSGSKLVNGTTTNASKDEDSIDPLDKIDPSLDLGIADFKMDSDMAAVMEEALASINAGNADSMGDGSDKTEGIFQDDGDVEQYVKCPTNLPQEMLVNVDKIKEAAKKSAEGKCKFFTPSVNQLLLQIEIQSRDVTCSTRSQMYSHLASHLPCGKETLLKRAKKLRLSVQDGSIKEPIQKLREAIAKAMPENIHKHNEECQLHALEKANRMMEEKEKVKEKEERRGSDEDDDKKSKQGNFGPRKKFQWTDHIRKLLCDVMSIKINTYEVLKSRTQSAEELIKSFLDTEVKPLWPQGWIQTRMLYKETRSVHGHLTSNQPIKPKKVLLATKKVLTKKPGNEDLQLGQSSVSVASIIAQAMMSPNETSNQFTPVSEKGTPPERVPTLLDYASNSMGVDSQHGHTPNALYKDRQISKQTTPVSSLQSSGMYKDSAVNAASAQGNSKHGVRDFTASFMEKLIADELAATDKQTSQPQPPVSQARPLGSQTQQAPDLTRQPPQIHKQHLEVAVPKTSPTVDQRRQSDMSIADIVAATAKALAVPKSSPTGEQLQQSDMSIADIVAATAKSMETSVPKERQASTVLKQLSTQAQNIQNRALAAPIRSGLVVRKVDAFGSSQERLKKLSVMEGQKTPINANIQKQTTLSQISGPNQTLAQTIQKLSSSIACCKVVTASSDTISSSRVNLQPAVVVPRVSGSTTKHNTYSNTQKLQPVVHLTRPPTIEKIITSNASKPQVRIATTKVSPHLSSSPRMTVQPVRTLMATNPVRVSVQSVLKNTAESVVDSQVRHLSPAKLQADMGNIFANLSDPMFTSPSVSSKELPYYTSPSGKNSLPKTNQSGSHSYHQQNSPSHPIHVAPSYSPPAKVSKHPALSASGSAFTAPSPPKPKPSTPPTLSPSTSPVGQKYPSYVTQRTSPNQTSPKYPTTYNSPSMASIPGYQQLSLADLTHKQATSGYTQRYPLTANQGQGSAAAGHQSPGDAIITGPAPGTFFHQQAGSGGRLGPMQSPTEQPYQLPPWPQ